MPAPQLQKLNWTSTDVLRKSMAIGMHSLRISSFYLKQVRVKIPYGESVPKKKEILVIGTCFVKSATRIMFLSTFIQTIIILFDSTIQGKHAQFYYSDHVLIKGYLPPIIARY